MARLEWSKPEQRNYDSGVDRGVLNVNGTECVPWSGLVSVEESPEEGEEDVTHYNGLKIYNSRKPSNYSGTITAFYSPPEFDECDGTLDVGNGLFTTNNSPKPFNFSWRSGVGPYDYKLHFVYNALAVPADRNYETMSESRDLEPISWDITTRPVLTEGVPRSAHFYVDTTTTSLFAIHMIEQALYGTSRTARTPRFPPPEELQTFVETSNDVTVRSLSDGRWEISGPSSVSRMISSVEQLFEIDWPGIDDLGHGIFRIRG